MSLSFGQILVILVVGFILFGNVPEKIKQFFSFVKSNGKGFGSFGVFYDKFKNNSVCKLLLF